MKKRLTAMTLTLLGLAAAQEIQPVSPTPTAPGTVEPLPLPPVNVPVTFVLPGKLEGVSAALSSPLALKGKASVVLTIKNTTTKTVGLATNRDNRQNCAFAPSLRVIRVGTREVVYPDGSGNTRLCAQDMKTDTLRAGGTLHYTRTLNLPAGEYMIEGWYLGSADGSRVKIDAQPLKVTVK